MRADNQEIAMEQSITPGEHLVAQGERLIRVENDAMLSVAIQRPRNEAIILKNALAELDLVPEEAWAAYYEIPYQETLPDGSRRTVKVSGPSIKAAMALARRWGNCSATARVLNEDKEGFDLEGVMLDFETNFRICRPMRIGKYIKTKRGVILLDPRRQEQAIQAGASKAIRNAILAGLPAYLVHAYDKRAREITGGKLEVKAEKKVVAAVLKAFAKWKVTQGQLETYAESEMAEWTGAEVASLRGLWNSINEGQTTVEDAFPLTPDATNGKGSGSVTVTPESLFGGNVTGQDNVEPGKTTASMPASATISPSAMPEAGDQADDAPQGTQDRQEQIWATLRARALAAGVDAQYFDESRQRGNSEDVIREYVEMVEKRQKGVSA